MLIFLSVQPTTTLQIPVMQMLILVKTRWAVKSSLTITQDCLSVCLSVCLYVRLSLCLFVGLSVCAFESVFVSVHCPFIFLSPYCFSFCLTVCLILSSCLCMYVCGYWWLRVWKLWWLGTESLVATYFGVLITRQDDMLLKPFWLISYFYLKVTIYDLEDLDLAR